MAWLPAVALVAVGCIERNNEWDPIFANTIRRDSVLVANSEFLDSLERLRLGAESLLVSAAASFAADSLDNDSIQSRNEGVRTDNKSIGMENESVRESNASAGPGKPPIELKPWSNLSLLVPPGDPGSLEGKSQEVQLWKLEAEIHMDSVNREHEPPIIYSPESIDSLKSVYQGTIIRIESWLAGAREYGQSVTETDSFAIIPYNDSVSIYNRRIAAYNDSVKFYVWAADKPVARDDAGLKNLADSAVAGDTIVLGAEAFLVDLRVTGSGTVDSPIVFIGNPVAPPRLASLSLSGKSYIQFHNVVFSNKESNDTSLFTGTKLVDNSMGIAFDGCEFLDNAGWGVEIVDSEAELVNCRILGNAKGGIRISDGDSAGHLIRLNNVLIANNSGPGLEGVNMAGEIFRSTISRNDSTGILLKSPTGRLTISNSLITFNKVGIHLQPTPNLSGQFTLVSSFFHGNTTAAIEADSLTLAHLVILVSDPQYANPSTGDYSPAPSSVVGQLESSGVVIGYRDNRP